MPSIIAIPFQQRINPLARLILKLDITLIRNIWFSRRIDQILKFHYPEYIIHVLQVISNYFFIAKYLSRSTKGREDLLCCSPRNFILLLLSATARWPVLRQSIMHRKVSQRKVVQISSQERTNTRDKNVPFKRCLQGPFCNYVGSNFHSSSKS